MSVSLCLPVKGSSTTSIVDADRFPVLMQSVNPEVVRIMLGYDDGQKKVKCSFS